MATEQKKSRAPGAEAKADAVNGLYERWLEFERATGRPMTAILDDLNAACDTQYKHNWPSVMAGRKYSLDRLPTNVRRYMMSKVLPVELKKLGVEVSKKKLESLIIRLT